jgi:hypothetical protein
VGLLSNIYDNTARNLQQAAAPYMGALGLLDAAGASAYNMGVTGVAGAGGVLARNFGSDPVQTARHVRQNISDWSMQPRTAAGRAALSTLGSTAASGLSAANRGAGSLLGVQPSQIAQSVSNSFSPETRADASTLLDASQLLPFVGGAKGLVGAGLDAADAARAPLSTLNVGMNIGKGARTLTPDRVMGALRAQGADVHSVEHAPAGASEPTMIVKLKSPLPDTKVHDLASALEQDAIPQYTPGVGGKLHGPKAADWGEFNPDYFQTGGAGIDSLLQPKGQRGIIGPLFHGTDQDFAHFNHSEDIGYHFGTPDTANARITQAQMRDGANIRPHLLDINNPLRLPDLHTWSPEAVKAELVKAKVITQAEAEGTDLVDQSQVRDWLKAKGYDGIVYKNAAEGGGDSYIAMHSKQVQPALGASPAFKSQRGAVGDLTRQDFENATNPDAPFPQYADAYPENGPPVPTTDPKTGKTYNAKSNTPEGAAFMKARAAIQKDMDKNGYTPFFPPEQRFYVNPADYPMSGDTLTDTLPKKQATIDAKDSLINTPEARQRLDAAYKQGLLDPGAKDWYAMGQVEQRAKQELGDEAGRTAFAHRAVVPYAATTGGADPTANLLTAGFVNYQHDKGLAAAIPSTTVPSPVGGRYLAGNLQMGDKLTSLDQMDAATNPKRHNFAGNILGHREMSTIDEQMAGLIKPGSAAPAPNEFGMYQRPLHDNAAAAGVEPANYQDVAWAGAKNLSTGGKYQGSPLVSHWNAAIERTHRLTGVSRAEIFRRWMGKGPPMPLYGAAGAGLLNHFYGSQPQQD